MALVGKKRRVTIIAVLGIAVAAGAYAFAVKAREDYVASIALYDIDYPKFSDWKKVPAGPYSLFRFDSPQGKTRIQGSVNRIEAEVNPTPDLDTRGIAQYYLDRTTENMPGWKAKFLGKVQAKNVDFAVIHRENHERSVVTGFAVKGNTTLIVSMTGGGPNMKTVSDNVDEFQDYLKGFKFDPRPESPKEATEDF